MEQSFQSLLLAGKYIDGDGNFLPFRTSDEAHIHSQLCSQTRNYEKYLLSSLIYPYNSSMCFDFAGNINLQSAMICESFNEYSIRRCVETEEKLKRMKTEPSTESSYNITPTTVFSHLPELRSIELANQQERNLKQKFSPIEVSANLQMLEPTVTNFQLAASYFTPKTFEAPRPPPPPSNKSTTEQRMRSGNKLSYKTRLLQNLLPVEKKMDTATTYEETYKYIKFLKAQISVLESMPASSTSGSNFRSENPRYGNLYGRLGKFNRQQLLEILVNSPAAQSILYSKGCCVYSVEQLMLYNDIAARSFFPDH